MSAQIEPLEKRSYPRVEMTEVVQLTDDNGKSISAELRDVSPDGLQAVCAKSEVAPFLAKRTPPATIAAEFSLPGGCEKISAECRIIHISVLDDGRVAMGVKFVQFCENSRSLLGKFIVSAMEHA